MRTTKSQGAESAPEAARLCYRGWCVASRILPACRPQAVSILAKIAVALLALLVVGSSTWGQSTTSLRGTVVDPSGKAVAGASVVLANSDSKTERGATTGEQGEYQFLFVPPESTRSP